MNRAIEIVVMALGGLSIFAVCFAGFSSLSGVPLSEVPGIGSLFPEPEETPSEARNTEPPPKRRSDTEVIQTSLGSLGAWSLPAPYTARELRSLVDELKAKLLVLDRRERELERRQEDHEMEVETLQDRFASLEQLRTDLEQYESELNLREDEVTAMEGNQTERNLAKWRDVSTVLALLPAEEAAAKIVQYPPDDAAEILRAMTDTAAGSILTSIPDENFREYLDAYSEKNGAQK